MILDKPTADQCVVVNDHLRAVLQAGINVTLTGTQKMTQERTLKLAGSGAMFEPIVLVKTSSVVGGVAPPIETLQNGEITTIQ